MKREIDLDKLMKVMHKFIDEIGELVTPPDPANHPATPESSEEIPEAVLSDEAIADAYYSSVPAGRPVASPYMDSLRAVATAAIHADRKARPGVVSKHALGVCMNQAENPDMRMAICNQIVRLLESAGVTITD